MRELIIGTRGSLLALWQAEYIQKRLNQELGLKSRLKIIKTKGDKILDTPLSKIGGKGLFTKELEEKLLDREIDLAVHSLKDVPVEFIDGLGLACITEREDPRDCFLSMKYQSLDDLPKGSKVGTTSLRRTMQIKRFRPDLDTQSLRGNVQKRLERLKNGDFDAIILARAGINRLQINEVNCIKTFSTQEMIPAMGQGALGIEIRLSDEQEDREIYQLLQTFNHQPTAICTLAERAFIRTLDGGCQVPIGVYARIDGVKIFISAILGLPDGSEILKDEIQGDINNAEALAIDLANRFLDRNASEILDKTKALF